MHLEAVHVSLVPFHEYIVHGIDAYCIAETPSPRNPFSQMYNVYYAQHIRQIDFRTDVQNFSPGIHLAKCITSIMHNIRQIDIRTDVQVM